MLISQKKSALYLKSLFKQLGINHIVICPGSRNLPLIISFSNDSYFNVISVIDERSAGFIALGIAKQNQKPAVVITTSGSAAINLAPAMAEAYYQNLPLIAISADRPKELINKGENQTIIQSGLYKNYVTYEFELVEDISFKDFELFAHKFYSATSFDHKIGNIHINLPYTEPLNLTQNIIGDFNFNIPFNAKYKSNKCLQLNINKCHNVLLYISTISINEELNANLKWGIENKNWVVISEIYSGFYHPELISDIDLMLNNEILTQNPDVLITIGESILSKPFRNYISKYKDIKHLDISFKARNWNSLSTDYLNINIQNYSELNSILDQLPKNQPEYSAQWKKEAQFCRNYSLNFLDKPEYKEFWTLNNILQNSENQSIFYWGNSSAIRYANWSNWNNRSDLTHIANRGISGIEGVLSSAIGYQITRKAEHFYCILGDISLLYESNALQSIHLVENIKIIVLNNHGGKIFENIHRNEELGNTLALTTPQNYNLSILAQLFDIEYFKSIDLNSFQTIFLQLLDKKGRILFEINYPEGSNSQWKEYFQKFK